MSFHACSAITSAFRSDASSNAIAVARSEVEPSIPTSTGACAGCGICGSASRMSATGQCACRISPELTEPRILRDSAPRPREPTTMSSASLDWSTRVGTGVGEDSNSPAMCTRAVSAIASRAIADACASRLRPSACCSSGDSSRTGACDHVAAAGLSTCTTVSGKPRMAASCAAQLTAASDSGDPSMPTMIP